MSYSRFWPTSPLWGENCSNVAAALREAYGAGNDAVAFFDFFASPPADFEPRALAAQSSQGRPVVTGRPWQQIGWVIP